MKSRRLTGLSAAAVLMLGMSIPALADVTVVATVDKTANKNVTENVTVNKTYDINATQKVIPTNSAEADAVKNASNYSNVVNEDPMTNTATIQDDGAGNGSFDQANGVIGVNQSPGSINNQGNGTSIAMTKAGDAIVHANSSAQEVNGGYVVQDSTSGTGLGNVLNATQSIRTDQVLNSFTGATGVVGVNQAAGDMNNQDNAVSLSLGTDAIASLSQADLGMTNSYGQINDFDSQNSDTLSGAFGGVAGVVSVNQSSGSLNNQANTVSIAATTFPVP